MRGEASFVFWNAVDPSMEAPGETPVSHGPENKWGASLVRAPRALGSVIALWVA
jgi:hypothetical protein